MQPAGIEVVYKTVENMPLTLHLFLPHQPLTPARRPAILFFMVAGLSAAIPLSSSSTVHTLHRVASWLPVHATG